MAGIRRILVAVNALDAKALPAVLKSAQIARAYRAQVELYHSLDAPVYADLYGLESQTLPDLERNLRQQAIRKLEDIADRLRQHDLKVSVSAEWDFPAYEAIVRRAVRIKADLIVTAAHAGRHRLPSLMRLTDWELMRLSPVPILVVKNPRPYRHPAILAAIDPTHAFAKPLQLDKSILHLGANLREKLRGTLHVVHAFAGALGVTPPVMGITPTVIEQILQEVQREAKVKFDRALRGTRIARSRRYLLAHDPVTGISEAARKSRSAIVIMGAMSRTGFKRLLIGNTAERLLDDLSCDILVVKSSKFRSRVPRKARGAHLVVSPPLTMGFY